MMRSRPFLLYRFSGPLLRRLVALSISQEGLPTPCLKR